MAPTGGAARTTRAGSRRPASSISLAHVDAFDHTGGRTGGMVGAAAVEEERPLLGDDAARPELQRQNFGLRPCVLASAVSAALLLLVLIAYYAIVLQNFTYVFAPEFTLADVPYYPVPHPSSTAAWKLADRYGVWWVLTALSLLRLGSVVGTHMAVAAAAVEGHEFPLSFMQGWIVLYGLADFAIAVFYIVTAYSRMCSATPVCRDWSAPIGDLDAGANWVFLLHTWFSTAFVVVHIAYYELLGGAIKRIERAKNAMLVDEETKDP